MESIDLQLNLDPRNYVQGVGQAAAATAQLAAGQAQIQQGANGVERALKVMTPKALTASFVGFTAVAASTESRLAGMQATAAVTGQSMGRLSKTMNDLARTFPVGNRGAQQIVQGLQQAGFSAAGNEKKIAGLAKAVTNLGAATGENASEVGRNLITLNRAFGNTEMDPKRFERMSDSLTNLSARSGASASNILQFSKNIAPLARSAGLGQTSVMGISTAFAKLGEDGFRASNTMNKVLSDLNRSLRDGTPELNTYANMVGKTREEFEGLAKTNMPEAVSQIFEAMGAAGPAQGQRMLENIGLEGVTHQRSVQAVTQAGGTREFMNMARDSYGNGDTAKAAAQAMDGLTDSLEKLGASSEQIASAFGTPLLGAVTKFTDQLAGATGALAKLMSSGPIQGLMKVAGGLAGGLGAIAGIAAMGFAARQLGRNGALAGALARNAPVSAMRAVGIQERINRGEGISNRQARFMERQGNQLLGRIRADQDPVRNARMDTLRQLQAAGRLTPRRAAELERLQSQGVQGAMRGITGRAAEVAQGYSSQRDANRRSAPTIRQASAGLVRSAVAWGGAAVRGWTTVQDDLVNQQRGLAGARTSAVRFGRDEQGRATGMGGKIWDSLKDADKNTKSFGERLGNARKAVQDHHKAITQNTGAVRTLMNATATTAKSMMASAALISKAGMAAAGGAMRSIAGSTLGMVGGVGGLALMGGMVGLNAYKNAQQNTKERAEDDSNASVTGTRDRYLESMGRAADATMSFAAQADAAANALRKSVPDNPTTLSAEERRRAEKEPINTNYSGSVQGVIEQINSSFAGEPVTDDLMSAIATDLAKTGQNRGQGFREQDINAILKGIRREPGQDGPYAASGTVPVDYKALLSDAGADEEGTGIGMRLWRGLSGVQGSTGGDDKNKFAKGFMTGISPVAWVSKGAAALGADWGEVGGRFNSISTTKEQESAISSVREGIAQNEQRQSVDYGAGYARQEAMKSANEAMAEAMKTGNADLVARMSEVLSEQVGAKRQVVSGREIEEAGGFIQALQAQDKQFADYFGSLEAGGQKASVTGAGISATAVDSDLTRAMDGIDLFGRMVSNRAEDVDSAMNKAAKAFRDMPSPENFRKAVDATITESQRLGMSLGEVADAAVLAMSKLGTAASTDFRVAQAVLAESAGANQRSAGRQGTGATIATGLRVANAQMNMDPNAEGGPETIQQGVESAYALVAQAEDIMRSRLAAEIQFQTQMTRTQYDYNLQREHAEEDFERNMARQREDYGIQRARQVANFNRQVARATEDFHRGQQRAQRDFNIQMQRMNEDAAKSMYDPYKRIQVQAIYDLGTLTVNLREQNQAMQRQAATLENLRSMGLSNDAIDQLGLNKSENAQQAERIAADLASGGAGAVEQLNAQVAERMAAGAVLFQDQSNKDLARQREDFNRSLADQVEDFNRSMARQQEDFNRGMSEMAADFNRAMERAAADQDRGMERMADSFNRSISRAREDHKRGQSEILGDYATLQKAMQDAMGGNIKTGTNLMKDTATTAASEVEKVLKDLDPDLRKLFTQDGLIQLNVSSPGTATSRDGKRTYTGEQEHRRGGADSEENVSGGPGLANVMTGYRLSSGYGMRTHPITGKPKLHSGQDWAAPTGAPVGAYKEGTVAHAGWAGGYGKAVYIDHGGGKMTRYAHLSAIEASVGEHVSPGERIGRVGSTGQSTGPHLHFEMRVGGVAKDPRTRPFAQGGIVTQPTRALIGEAGSNEAVIPLNTQGVEVLARAMQRYLTMGALDGTRTGQARTHVTYQTTITNTDMSTQVTGDIQVVSNDPLDMARQLQMKARRDNLGRTPTARSR